MGRTISSDSANVIPLPASPTGFIAGDYVYQTSSGYGAVPNGALATGMFDVGNLPALVSTSTATSFNELTYVEQLGGSQGSQVAAQLINGNIVYAYAKGDPSTYTSPSTVNFRIETTGGTVVVAETSTTMSARGPYQVGVIALPAGGFAIVCTAPNSSTNYNLNARFYAADGTAATAVLALTSPAIAGNGSTTSRLKLQPLTDGSVIIGYINGTTFELRKVTTAGFDATFGASGVASIPSFTSPTQWWDFITDSSNNIQVISSTGTSSVVMQRYNSSGVQQATFSLTTLSNITALAIAISSSGTIRGFAQGSGVSGVGVYVIAWDGTTATLGGRIASSSTVASNGALGAFAQGSSGGYVIFYNKPLPNNSAIGLYFQVFDSSDVSVAPETRVNPAIAVNYRNQFTPIVVSGDTRVYFGVFQYQDIAYQLSAMVNPMGIAYFSYSNTTYALGGGTTSNTNFGSQGPFALGDYLRGVSTADTARFTIAATGSYPATYAAGATVIPKTLIDGSNTSQRPLLCPLTNGEFVTVWARGTGQTYISKYSSAGVLQVGPVAVYGTSGNGNALYATSVCTFANGNIFVTYADNISVNTLKYIIYTPSLTVVTSGNIDASYNRNVVASASFGQGSHVAVAYPNNGTNYIATKVVADDGTVTSVGPLLNTGSPYTGLQIIGFKSSSFAVLAEQSQSTWGFVVRQTGAATFLAPSSAIQYTNLTLSASGNIISNPIPSSGTTGYFVANKTGSAFLNLLSVNPFSNAAGTLREQNLNSTPFTGSVGTGTSVSITYTPNGTPVIVTNYTITGGANFITLSPFSMAMTGISFTVTGAITTALSSGGGSYTVSAIPHAGEAVLIAYGDASGSPAFASIAASEFSSTTTLTAGTDISTSTLGLSLDTGYVLQGISATAATSGDIGLVQTAGTAILNSNYSAATPATLFDFRNQITFGVSGMILGRNVTMRS